MVCGGPVASARLLAGRGTRLLVVNRGSYSPTAVDRGSGSLDYHIGAREGWWRPEGLLGTVAGSRRGDRRSPAGDRASSQQREEVGRKKKNENGVGRNVEDESDLGSHTSVTGK
jgi:hypothetical protein